MQLLRPLLVELKTDPLHLRLTAGGIVYGLALNPVQAQSLALALLANIPADGLLPEIEEAIKATAAERRAGDAAFLGEMGVVQRCPGKRPQTKFGTANAIRATSTKAPSGALR